MHKCEKCGREFNTEEGLNQHAADKHGMSRHEKKEMKKQREEERKEEINKKIKKGKIKKWAIIAVVIIALVGIGYVIATSIPPSSGTVVGPPGSTHIHHDFKMYVNGNAVDFSQPKYQLRSRVVHFEDGDGNVMHTHATGMTLGYALNTMGIQLTECLAIDEIKHCNDGNKTVKVYVNGAANSEFGDYLMKDLDKILVSYGSEPVEPQLASITNLARTQSGRVMNP